MSGTETFCEWLQKAAPKGFTGKAFSHTLRQGPWSECSRKGPRCWIAATSKGEKWLVAGVDQNAGKWPDSAIYDFESGKPNAAGIYDNDSPYATIAKGDPLGGENNKDANVWVSNSYVDCDTGLMPVA